MSADTTDSNKPKKEKAASAAEIQADLEAKRAELANTVDGLTAQLDPRQNIADLKAQLRDTAANASDEAQEFVTQLQRGDRRAVEVAGGALAAVGALVGLILIRRRR